LRKKLEVRNLFVRCPFAALPSVVAFKGQQNSPKPNNDMNMKRTSLCTSNPPAASAWLTCRPTTGKETSPEFER
jgi:hypothetical protein